MIAYSAYKNYKERQEAHSTAGYTRKLSTDDSDTTPLGVDITKGNLARESTFVDVVDKKQSRKQWIALAISLFVDVVLPLALYYILKNYVSTLAALLISSAPPAVSVIFKAIYFKRFDPLGLVIVFGFALSFAISFIDGDARVLLLRESIVTAATGAIFLVTLIPIKIGKFQMKPLTFGVVRQMMAATPNIRYMRYGEMIEVSRAEFSWTFSKKFRNSMRLGTLLWGIALELEFTAKLIMFFSSLTIDQMVLYGNIVLATVMGGMFLVTMIQSHMIHKALAKEMIEIRRRLEAEAAEYISETQPYHPDAEMA